MNYILFDDNKLVQNLLPLTYTRPISEIRLGILSIKEKWEKLLGHEVSYLCQDYLQAKFPLKTEAENIYINSSILPSRQLIFHIQNLNKSECLFFQDTWIAAKAEPTEKFEDLKKVDCPTGVLQIKNLWDIFVLNKASIKADFELLTQNRQSAKLSNTNQVINPERVFCESGASVECAILNPTDGYIYIGKNAQIMEGAVLRGSVALCEHAVVKVNAKIYGSTSIGRFSKIGGEVADAVIFGYSNKGHEGFLGNSILGEWCNLGAGTNTSNLKNTYNKVRLWNYAEKRFADTKQQFCGLIMGDHSKCGINTMFNTGTVVGVGCNIFGAGFPRNFIPSFAEGGAFGFKQQRFERFLKTAEQVMKRREKKLNNTEIAMLKHVFSLSEMYRNF
ncbi:MAG: glucose-1-phosphate thymidylyltransferase [Bacteroidia bacterium]|nr:MAG: glucose-1-phosphate thymidylyltransferase [Bacteroidia bacterium]